MGFDELQPQHEQPEVNPPLTSSDTQKINQSDGELPPSARTGSSDVGQLKTSSRSKSRSGLWAVLAAAAAVGILGLALLAGGGGSETQSPNWHHVAAASEHSASGEDVVKFVGRDGSVAFLSTIAITQADRDLATTEAVKAALQENDLAKAEKILREAQKIPEPAKPNVSSPAANPSTRTSPQQQTVADEAQVDIQPRISDGLRQEILRGDTEFFHIYLYDCCDQDGDVVDVVLNGQPFQRVPITNAGATLSVPISGAPVSVAIRGVHDGGGGITVACRTSQGDSFSKSMAPGEIQLLGVVKQ